MQECDREGLFRAEIVEHRIFNATSGAVSVNIHVLLTEHFDRQSNEWIPWREYEMSASGDVWVIKKDGTLNEKAAQSLIDCAGWDGNLESVGSMEAWNPTPLQVEVKADTYKDQTWFRVAFLNEYDRPAGKRTVAPQFVRELQEQHGSALRALAGNRMRPQPPAASKPAAPPRPQSAPAPQPAMAGAPADDDIPF